VIRVPVSNEAETVVRPQVVTLFKVSKLSGVAP